MARTKKRSQQLVKESNQNRNDKGQVASAIDADIPSDGDAYLQSLKNLEVVEYVRCTIKEAHILKVALAAKPDEGWKATDLYHELWQGTLKVVDRAEHSVILLMKKSGDIVSVFRLVHPDSVERCMDSSRYFVVQVRDVSSSCNNNCRYIGIAFNERTHAFDFNVALQVSQQERVDREQREKNVVAKMKSANILDNLENGK